MLDSVWHSLSRDSLGRALVILIEGWALLIHIFLEIPFL